MSAEVAAAAVAGAVSATAAAAVTSRTRATPKPTNVPASRGMDGRDLAPTGYALSGEGEANRRACRARAAVGGAGARAEGHAAALRRGHVGVVGRR